MARLRSGQRQQVFAQRFFVGRTVRPECPPCRPVRSKAFIVGDRILHDQSLHTLRVCQRHAKTNRAAVVLHVERVMRQSQRLREIVHYGRDVVESVIELLRIRPVAMSEARIIRRDQMDICLQAASAAAETSATMMEDRAEEESWERLSARFPVEDGESIYLDRAIEHLLLHSLVLLLGLRAKAVARKNGNASQSPNDRLVKFMDPLISHIDIIEAGR